MKKGTCDPMAGAAWMMCKFLGAYLLIAGLNMLLNYQGSVDFMMAAAGKPGMAALHPLSDVLTMAVAYSWPIVKPLIGLSFLLCMKKCWATMALYVYLLFFLLGHMMAGDMTGGTFVMVTTLFLSCMMAYGGMSGSCDQKK